MGQHQPVAWGCTLCLAFAYACGGSTVHGSAQTDAGPTHGGSGGGGGTGGATGTGGGAAGMAGTGGARACIPGQQITCPCSGASALGVQACLPDGSGYERCTGCPSALDGGSPGSGGSGGTGGLAGTGGAQAACDLLAQTGCGSGEKCTTDDTVSPPVIVCAANGTVAPGGDCRFGSVSADDCAGGAICTTWGRGDNDPGAIVYHAVCQSYCATDRDCARAEGGPAGTPYCLGFEANCFGSPSCGPNLPGGFCVESCTPFVTDCGATATCANLFTDVDGATMFFTCHFLGRGVAGSPCESQSDCGANMACFYGLVDPTTATCVQLCDGVGHDCPVGTTCSTTGSQTGECR